MLRDKRVIVTGGGGFLGRAVCAALHERDARVFAPRRREFDLTSERDCRRMYVSAFGGNPTDVVIHLAAEVGGIGANQANPGRYFYANMAMALHLVELFRQMDSGGKFVMAGTTCAYPKHTPVPFKESDLWAGYPEETNAPYGVAKRAAWQMLDAYHRQYGMRCAYVLPANLYGPHDNFDLATSHVIPALIRKCIEADGEITVWGTGSASREFLYVDDAAEGIVRAAETLDSPEPVNLGTGQEVTIFQLVMLIAEIAKFRGAVRWDASKPDGQPRRRLDTTRAAELLGWRAAVPLEEGLRRTIDWYLTGPGASP